MAIKKKKVVQNTESEVIKQDAAPEQEPSTTLVSKLPVANTFHLTKNKELKEKTNAYIKANPDNLIVQNLLTPLMSIYEDSMTIDRIVLAVSNIDDVLKSNAEYLRTDDELSAILMAQKQYWMRERVTALDVIRKKKSRAGEPQMTVNQLRAMQEEEERKRNESKLTEDKKKQIDELNEKAKQASDEYYNTGETSMSDKEYDDLTAELAQLEEETGYSPSDSVTTNVGAPVRAVDGLKKVKHEEKALSLDKTKDRDSLAGWLNGQAGVLSWKLDGLTCVVTYDNGQFVSAVTRGNGEIGEDISHNAPFINGIPQTIPYKNHLVVRGEALMTYKNFEKVNSALPADQKFKNPRNLASGTIRALDPNIVKQRGIDFIAFESVTPIADTFEKSLQQLKGMGFRPVPFVPVDPSIVVDAIGSFEKKVESLPFPTDGLVLQLNDLAYAKTLGTTGKFPRWAKAFKWSDELAQTTIRQIVWQPSRTGLINPVAVFDPVELEGTTVTRATCNNISFMEKHNLCVGSKIEVYKANMIIPTIHRNLTQTQGNYKTGIPQTCPRCGQPTQVAKTKDAYNLMCNNPQCPAKNIKGLVHFVGRDAMNIEGIAESTIDLLNRNGLLNTPLDFFNLKNHPEIAGFEGMGKESYNNMIQSIEKARHTTLSRYIYAWGIPSVGRTASKEIENLCKGNPEAFILAMNQGYDWTQVEGFGKGTDQKLKQWWASPMSSAFCSGVKLLSFNTLPKSTPKQQSASANNGISGKVFCVTGSVHVFKNRAEVGAYIEARGGRLASSVTSKTDYLVTNDTTSGSAKNKKAAELGKPILTEEQLIQLGGGL